MHTKVLILRKKQNLLRNEPGSFWISPFLNFIVLIIDYLKYFYNLNTRSLMFYLLL